MTTYSKKPPFKNLLDFGNPLLVEFSVVESKDDLLPELLQNLRPFFSHRNSITWCLPAKKTPHLYYIKYIEVPQANLILKVERTLLAQQLYPD
jgi:hypothetical protein